MDSEGLEKGIEELKLKEEKECDAHAQGQSQITCFSELVNDVSLHFQIIRFPKQVGFSPIKPFLFTFSIDSFLLLFFLYKNAISSNWVTLKQELNKSVRPKKGINSNWVSLVITFWFWKSEILIIEVTVLQCFDSFIFSPKRLF